LVDIAKHTGLVSIGAGSGFIEYLVRAEGASVYAYDLYAGGGDVDDNSDNTLRAEIIAEAIAGSITGSVDASADASVDSTTDATTSTNVASTIKTYRDTWTSQPWSNGVDFGTDLNVIAHSNNALLLSNPDSHTFVAVRTAFRFRGDTIIYIGEGRDGRNANDAFFDFLDYKFTVVEEYPLNTSYDNPDRMWVLKRVSPDSNTPSRVIPSKYHTLNDYIIEQQYVGAATRGEELSTDVDVATRQVHNGGFISWLTMAGASFDAAYDIVRYHDGDDITATLVRRGDFEHDMLVMLRGIRPLEASMGGVIAPQQPQHHHPQSGKKKKQSRRHYKTALS
jgi:hypothetical protein